MKKTGLISLIVVAMFVALAGCGASGSSKNENKLVIGIDDQFAPLGFRDKDNNIVGFDIDYARAAAEKMGKEAVFQPIDWKAKESELKSGRIDLIWNGYTITDERKEMVLFTKPYLENSQVIVTLVDSEIAGVNDLAGKVVGLQAQSSAADALDANPIKDKIKTVSEFSDNVLALSDLKTKRLDAVIIDEVVARYYLSQEEGTFKILDESLAPELYGIGVKQGNEELLNKLQQALDELNSDGTAAEISKKWFGEDKVLK
ncbi:amino acid ABC transporter substrate-binding protein [Paenibacillus lutimineralis]|uniref:Amino acid ABC transporter substrate-binding protein n=1 Tax=Paenibacillus lutimineralis TaxID=2707005 RepID=A0A3S9V6H0_9BACL|nr:amino acid ABC transporter substrate-binding protein [Paenibacillus lutimineralis]AZS18157.1 amino acid ABC transporter substrate-binding protein [Paenibacillus lutimineralis]